MRGPAARLFSALALTSMLATAAHAADTGSLSGAVFDRHGEPLAEATVKISGERLPPGRNVATGSNGTFLFDYLLPGTYTVEVDKPGVGNARRAAVVEVGKDTQVDFVVGIALEESVSVTAVVPVVDVRSTEVSFNFKAETLNSLPLERTYRGLFQLIPGVADNRHPIGPAAGGGRQDNTFLIDGVNITNVGFGYLSTEVNELDIAEVNLKRAGISAEFGRTAGTVTNAVSRSGTNTLSAIGRIRLAARGADRRLHAPGRAGASGRASGHVPRSGADDGNVGGRGARRTDPQGPHFLLRLGALLARGEMGPVQQGGDAAARRSARGA